jgi:dual specificity tyrosine-phosphorylation-regulated kinase 2/3/4
MEVLGVPSSRLLENSKRANLFFEKDLTPKPLDRNKTQKKVPGTRPLEDIMANAPESLINFVSRCLDWDPATRLKPSQALSHDWIEENHLQRLLKHPKEPKKKKPAS